MTIGERIKKIRVFRKMTMDELGGALGFEGKNMSVRISQYETGARIPGEDMILKLADRKSTRLNSSHSDRSRMPSSA